MKAGLSPESIKNSIAMKNKAKKTGILTYIGKSFFICLDFIFRGNLYYNFKDSSVVPSAKGKLPNCVIFSLLYVKTQQYNPTKNRKNIKSDRIG
jgi:hypothetical protein